MGLPGCSPGAWRRASWAWAARSILVRLLAPAEFGIVAIALSFIGSIDQFSQIGVEEALIRMPAPTGRHYDTAFTMIALRCCLIAAIVVIAAWPVAGFFNDPRLAPIMLAIAGVTVVAGLENSGPGLPPRHALRPGIHVPGRPALAGIIATVPSRSSGATTGR